MELTHSFSVPASVDETWTQFNDIEAVASCFPGAKVTSVEGDSFKGSCKVKLGPISLTYSGSGTFLEKDEQGHKFVMEAKGKDRRGNGTAAATVTATLAGGEAATDVTVLTDLAITGKPAQFGRGVMQDVSDKLLQQFIACLESRLGAGEAAASEEAQVKAEAASEKAAPPAAKKAPPAAKKAAAKKSAPPAAEKAEPAATTEPAAPEAPAEPVVEEAAAPAATAAAMAAGGDEAGGAPYDGVAPGGPSYTAPGVEQGENVLDLGTTVLPVLAKAYWKQAMGAVLVLVFLGWLIRRRH